MEEPSLLDIIIGVALMAVIALIVKWYVFDLTPMYLKAVDNTFHQEGK